MGLGVRAFCFRHRMAPDPGRVRLLSRQPPSATATISLPGDLVRPSNYRADAALPFLLLTSLFNPGRQNSGNCLSSHSPGLYIARACLRPNTNKVTRKCALPSRQLSSLASSPPSFPRTLASHYRTRRYILLQGKMRSWRRGRESMAGPRRSDPEIMLAVYFEWQ